MQLQRIVYDELNLKQKEIYNFQKVAAPLADYGFNCIKLDDDWQGADFLAFHKDGATTLRVQLKARVTISKKCKGKDLHLAFPADGRWYLVPHDKLISGMSLPGSGQGQSRRTRMPPPPAQSQRPPT